MSVLKICSECRTTVWLSSFCTWEIKKLLSIIINFFCGKFVKSPTFKLIHQLLSNRMCSFISWITIKFNGSHWPDQIYPFYVLKKAVSMLSRAADDGNFLPIMGRTSQNMIQTSNSLWNLLSCSANLWKRDNAQHPTSRQKCIQVMTSFYTIQCSAGHDMFIKYHLKLLNCVQKYVFYQLVA